MRRSTRWGRLLLLDKDVVDAEEEGDVDVDAELLVVRRLCWFCSSCGYLGSLFGLSENPDRRALADVSRHACRQTLLAVYR
mmetsp:Transcript_7875/g.17971  ORF Transcript_7875/g.17971 Transcript_7875/m.17971 type:complete len:81 (+) Transcript_7875:259-501(+)